MTKREQNKEMRKKRMVEQPRQQRILEHRQKWREPNTPYLTGRAKLTLIASVPRKGQKQAAQGGCRRREDHFPCEVQTSVSSEGNERRNKVVF